MATRRRTPYQMSIGREHIYVAKLESPYERVEVLKRGTGYRKGEALCAYYRNSLMCHFVAGPSQLKKIDAGKGQITLTQKMISDADLQGWR